MATAEATQLPPPAAMPAPPHLYLSMDGVLAHMHDTGWKEIKLGCVYTLKLC